MEPGNLSEQNKINIIQLASWLTAATANNKSFLLKPSDLKLLYTLVLWEAVKNSGVTTITNDEQIAIPEHELVKMVQLIFNKDYYTFFR